MHELTKYGLCQIYDEIWPTTSKYYDIEIKMHIIEQPLKNDLSSDWFLDCMNNLYSTYTMISYRSVKSQLELLGFRMHQIVHNAFPEHSSTNKMKDTLNLLFTRRNSIAHQFDRSHHDALSDTISEQLVENLINDIIKIVQSIHTYAQNMDKNK